VANKANETGKANEAGDVTCPFLRVAQVAGRTGLSVREVRRRSRSGPDFPRPRKLSTRKTVWVAMEVEAWVRGVIEAKAA